MSVQININSINKTSEIKTESVSLNRSMTSQGGILRFTIRRKSLADYYPALNDVIEVYEDAVKIFGGILVEMSEAPVESPYIQALDVTCKDYSFDMDKKLVIKTYTNQTVNQIITDILANFLPAGYTMANVNCPTNVSYIAFNYEYPSKCFQQLAEQTDYDWYVDENKDIHFFAKEDIPAPFGITDTGGKYITNTLQINRDLKNLRNSVIVRGGTYDGSSNTENKTADGNQTTFTQAYQYTNVSVTVAGVSKTIGIDFIDDPATKDCLYNFNEKAIKFRSDNKPTNGQIVAITGNPKIPVIVKVRESVSIEKYGEYQYKIIDKSITSKEAARERAKAEIAAWADKVSDGSFQTIEVGLDVGQSISVQSDIRNINEQYIISRISSRMRSATQFIHYVTLITKQNYGIIEFLQKLLMNKDKEIVINQNEVVDAIETANETIQISDAIAISKVHNPQTEAMSIVESVVAQALNYAVEFCVGDQLPSGTKRPFILEGSPLA